MFPISLPSSFSLYWMIKPLKPDESLQSDGNGESRPYYQYGNRNDLTMYLSGLMRKEDIAFQSAIKVIESIAEDDEEKPARIRTLQETYKKEDLHDVSGYSGLLSILIKQTQNRDEAKQIVEQVISIFPKIQDGKQSKVLWCCSFCPCLLLRPQSRFVVVM